jgi:hypothetical protein
MVFNTPAHTYTQSHHYTPNVSSPLSSSPLRASPLSPRDANVQTRDSVMSSPTPIPSKHATNQFSPEVANGNALMSPPNSRGSGRGGDRGSTFSKRTTKPNPLMGGRNSGEEGRETRRKLFLKKVREEAEQQRWKNRGGDEEIMRCIWVAEERRREERIRHEALGLVVSVTDDEERSLDELMADEVAIKEEQELEALVMSLSQQKMPREGEMDELLWGMNGHQGSSTTVPQDQPPTSDTPYGSDDDEYDHIFMDVMQKESRMASQQSQPNQHQGAGYADLEMDLS